MVFGNSVYWIRFDEEFSEKVIFPPQFYSLVVFDYLLLCFFLKHLYCAEI